MRANDSQLRGEGVSAPKPASLLTRDGLQSRLSSALSKRLTVVCAPAGFGKSLAIRRAMEERDEAAVSYHLGPADASAAALARGLAHAFSDLAPGLRPSYATAVEYALQSSDPHKKLALWFQRHLQDVRATVLLEDVHHAAGDPNACRFLESLIEYVPQVHWGLTTRTALELPLNRWVGEGIASAPISTEDLRLTKIEAHELARRSQFPAHLVETLFDDTLGWPLAFHIGTNLPDCVQELSRARVRTPQDAYAFLSRNLFERYDEPLREVLLETSVFSQIDAELIAAGPWADSWERLAELARGALLFSILREDTLRYHDLFQTFLQNELRASGRWESSLKAGADMLERCARIPEALRLYVQAGAPAEALALCEKHGFELMDRGRRDDVAAALASIDEARQSESPVVLALRGLNESQLGRNDTAEAWFLHGIQKANSEHVRAEIAYRYALDLIRHGRMDAIDLLEPLSGLKEEPASLRALIQSTLATAYVLAGRFDDAREAIGRALALAREDDSDTLQAKIHHQAAWVALFTGEIEPAKAHAGMAVDYALQCGMYDSAARAYSVFYNILYDVEDDPEGAMRVLDSVLDCGLKAGSPQLRLFALLGMLDIAAELGDHDQVERITETLAAHEVDFADAATSETLLPAQALATAARGDFAEAYRVLVPSAARQITPDRKALRYSEIALYAAAARMRAQAENALTEVLPALDALEPAARRTVRTRLNCALALRLLGDAERAQELLEQTAINDGDRLKAFSNAVRAIVARWDGAQNFNDVAGALQQLHERHFGGIAGALAALPNAAAPSSHASLGVR